jgi:hypothetical protein
MKKKSRRPRFRLETHVGFHQAGNAVEHPGTTWVITTRDVRRHPNIQGSGKSLCLSVSPARDIICDCNVGAIRAYLNSRIRRLVIKGKAADESSSSSTAVTGQSRSKPRRRRGGHPFSSSR